MIGSTVGGAERHEGWAGLISVFFDALRVRQWTKNLLLFAGLLFAAKLGDGTRWLEAFIAFGAYCLASSAAYLFNDVRDAEQDKFHPVKRNRPVASGALAPRTALRISVALAVLALVLASLLDLFSLLFLALFLLLQIAYSVRLKEVIGVDVLAIAGLFVLRAAAGAEAVEVRISPWLLACTALLALFLGLAKRRGELLQVGDARTPGRTVLAGYSLRTVEFLLAAAALGTVAAYSLYAFDARDVIEMAGTIPFVAFAIGRYTVLVHREGIGEEPETVLLTDLPILASVCAWAITAGVVLSLS